MMAAHQPVAPYEGSLSLRQSSFDQGFLQIHHWLLEKPLVRKEISWYSQLLQLREFSLKIENYPLKVSSDTLAFVYLHLLKKQNGTFIRQIKPHTSRTSAEGTARVCITTTRDLFQWLSIQRRRGELPKTVGPPKWYRACNWSHKTWRATREKQNEIGPINTCSRLQVNCGLQPALPEETLDRKRNKANVVYKFKSKELKLLIRAKLE